MWIKVMVWSVSDFFIFFILFLLFYLLILHTVPQKVRKDLWGIFFFYYYCRYSPQNWLQDLFGSVKIQQLQQFPGSSDQMITGDGSRKYGGFLLSCIHEYPRRVAGTFSQSLLLTAQTLQSLGGQQVVRHILYQIYFTRRKHPCFSNPENLFDLKWFGSPECEFPDSLFN